VLATANSEIGRLSDLSINSDTTFNSLQALIASMQQDLQAQLQKQYRDFEVRIKSLLVGQGKANQSTASDTYEIESSTFDPSSTPKGQELAFNANTGKTDDESPEQSLEKQCLSDPHRSPHQEDSPYFQSYSKPFHLQDHSLPRSASKIKASDLPKFSGGKEEDVEIWIEQISAIFDVNRSSTSEIVAFLSVILKDHALRWFTRLGSKGRARLSTWTLWKHTLRQRFLKANYPRQGRTFSRNAQADLLQLSPSVLW
jgi:hypothetical protein